MDKTDWNEKLLESAKYGDLESIKECLKQDANVNAKDKRFGATPLIYASYSGTDATQRLRAVKYLISKGANINAKTNYGDTALVRAIFINDFEITKYLISKGADINIKNRYGKTALDRAIRYAKLTKSNENSDKIIKYLKAHLRVKSKQNSYEMSM